MARSDPEGFNGWMLILSIALVLVVGAIGFLVFRGAEAERPNVEAIVDLPRPRLPDAPNPAPPPLPLPRPVG